MQTEKTVRIAATLLAAAAVVLCVASRLMAPKSSGAAVMPSMIMLFIAVYDLWGSPKNGNKNNSRIIP